MFAREIESLTRRGFLKLGAGAAALGALGGRSVLAAEAPAPEKKKIPIGLQLYTVRGECGKDFPGTVAAVAKMGYAGVDFAGYYGRTAPQLKQLLDDNGLKCCGSHIGLGTMRGDALKGTVEFHKAIGNKFLIVPGGIGGRTKQSWLDAAKTFNEIAEQLKPEGLLCGYHNHSHEFNPIDGETPWDIFFGNTSADVVMQLDVGNAMGGKADPVAILKKYPGRAKTLHVKGAGGIPGEDKAPWDEIFALCETIGGTEWYIVEADSSKYTPMECARRTFENLKRMGKA
jgi:sugar phosphate isomerase/epimerase